jgi:hypothetical protein
MQQAVQMSSGLIQQEILDDLVFIGGQELLSLERILAQQQFELGSAALATLKGDFDLVHAVADIPHGLEIPTGQGPIQRLDRLIDLVRETIHRGSITWQVTDRAEYGAGKFHHRGVGSIALDARMEFFGDDPEQAVTGEASEYRDGQGPFQGRLLEPRPGLDL